MTAFGKRAWNAIKARFISADDPFLSCPIATDCVAVTGVAIVKFEIDNLPQKCSSLQTASWKKRVALFLLLSRVCEFLPTCCGPASSRSGRLEA
jgi:hypothetical protein